MEKTMKTGELAELAEGSRFTYGGVEWVVLDHREGNTLCLAADVLEMRAFDENKKNDFVASSLRAYLNGEFLKKLIEAGANEAAFMPMVIDLTSDSDGTLLNVVACYGYGGVRPLCTLKSEILVSYDEEQIKKREVTTFQSALEAAVKKAFESLERRIVEGEGTKEPKGIQQRNTRKNQNIYGRLSKNEKYRKTARKHKYFA